MDEKYPRYSWQKFKFSAIFAFLTFSLDTIIFTLFYRFNSIFQFCNIKKKKLTFVSTAKSRYFSSWTFFFWNSRPLYVCLFDIFFLFSSYFGGTFQVVHDFQYLEFLKRKRKELNILLSKYLLETELIFLTQWDFLFAQKLVNNLHSVNYH